LVTEKGDVIDEVKKTFLLWLLQDQKSKVSNDRMIRFRTGKREVVIERVESESSFFVDKAIVPGDFICLSINVKGSICVVGQVLKFKYSEGTSKSDRRYPFNNFIVDLNKNVIVRLSPSYFVDKKGIFKTCSVEYFDMANYVCSIRKSSLDFGKKSLASRHLYILKEKFPNLF